MARVVFAEEELGSSRNPLRRSLAVAERMRADGHAVWFVVSDLIAADSLLTPRGIGFLPAPRFASQPARRPTNYWKLLAELGYDDREFLRARARAWLALFDRLGAEIVAVDRAPTARLAAEISQRQCLDLDAAVAAPPDRQSHAAVLENIEAVKSALSQDRLRDLPIQLQGKSRKPKDRRRIVFAWELGTNSGHVERGIAFSKALRERGHEVIFVVRDVDLAERLLAAEGFDFLPTPSTALPPPRFATVNFSDVLLTCGFADPQALAARVRAWTHLLRALDPDTIVIDHAPVAQLAAYITGLPMIFVNSGFSIPPITRPFPNIQPHMRITAEQLWRADQRALASVNEVMRRFAAPPLSHLSELFARSTQIITTFRELDVYPERDTGLFVGPVERVTHYPQAPWRTVGKIRVFVYMRPFIRDVEALLQVLHTCDAEVKFVLPGAAPALVARYQSAHFQIYTGPIELDSLLQEADLVVSYGSATLIAQVLLAGVPLLLVADVLEQIINSIRVVELGAGLLLHKNRDPATVAAAIKALTTQDRFRQAARNFAAKYRGRDTGACDRIVAAIEQTF